MKEPLYAIGYARVSSPKQAQEGESLEDQANAIRRFSQFNGWTLYPDDTILEEQFSGKVGIRPLYEHALKLIKKNPGKIKYFIVKVIDRFSRAGSMEYQLMKADLARLGVELRDIGGVIQPKVNSLDHLGFNYEWSMISPSQISEVVLAEQARSERSSILTRLIAAEIGLTQSGFQIGPANDGFVNAFVEFDGRKKCVQAPDPERAHFFVEMFNLRAEGIYSDEEIVERVNGLGYRSKTKKRWSANKTKVVSHTIPGKLTVKQLQRIISRPAYCGIICEKWTHNLPIRAKWDGLVSISTFNRANRGKVYIQELEDGTISILRNLNKKKLTDKRNNYRKDFEYKNVVMCPHCGKAMLASFPRGKSGKGFGTYHCARKHAYYGISKVTMDKAWASYLPSLQFTQEFLEKLEIVLIAGFRKREGAIAKETGSANQQVALLQDKKATLLESFNNATTPIMRQIIEEQAVKLQMEIDAARELRERLEVKEDDIHSFIAHAKILMEHPAKMLMDITNKQEQLELFNLFFDEFPTYQKLLNGTPKTSLVFKLKEEFVRSKSQFVSVQSLEWNSIEKMIMQWNRLFDALKNRKAKLSERLT